MIPTWQLSLTQTKVMGASADSRDHPSLLILVQLSYGGTQSDYLDRADDDWLCGSRCLDPSYFIHGQPCQCPGPTWTGCPHSLGDEAMGPADRWKLLHIDLVSTRK